MGLKTVVFVLLLTSSLALRLHEANAHTNLGKELAEATAEVDRRYEDDESQDLRNANVKPSIFCFSFSPLRPQDVAMLEEVKRQMSLCDGHMFFSDLEAPDVNATVTRVRVPVQRQKRSETNWLLGRNMAGLMPALSHLFKHNILQKYDWAVNVELDHFVRPTYVRSLIQDTHDSLLKENKVSANKPLMLSWQNVFLLNRELISQMHNQWDVLGKVIDKDFEHLDNIPHGLNSGCPDFLLASGSTAGSPCAQDIAFPIMAALMDPPVPIHGAQAGRSLPQETCIHRGVWDFQSLGQSWDTEPAQLKAIRSISHGDVSSFASSHDSIGMGSSQTMPHMPHVAEALEELKSLQRVKDISNRARLDKMVQAVQGIRDRDAGLDLAQSMTHSTSMPCKSVPILHHAKYASVHKLAREVLGL